MFRASQPTFLLLWFHFTITNTNTTVTVAVTVAITTEMRRSSIYWMLLARLDAPTL